MNDSTRYDRALLRGPVALSHLIIRQFVREGDTVIDATCGNGHDTCLLAELTGACGTVWGFDIQRKAIEATAARLDAGGYLDRVVLIQAGHETIAEHVYTAVTAIIFNLGYLPGSDRSVVTRSGSTLAGLEQSLKILEPAGVILITVYPGHDEGRKESAALEDRIARLPAAGFHVWRMGQTNVSTTAPYLMLIQKAV